LKVFAQISLEGSLFQAFKFKTESLTLWSPLRIGAVNKNRALSVVVISCLFFFSCASTREIKVLPAFRVADITLSKAVEDRTSNASPQNPAIVFSPKDPEVFAFLKLQNLWGMHTVKWDWIDPEGRLYYSTGNYTIKSAEGQYLKEVNTWHKLTIRGDKAEKLPGQWTLNIHVDKDLVAVRKFRIDPEASELPAIAPGPK
jgi:hypothetical protein